MHNISAALLIGNGINARSDKAELFSNRAINDRFIYSIEKYARSEIKQDDLRKMIIDSKNSLEENASKYNIEQLAYKLYISVINEFRNRYGYIISDNDDRRLKLFLRKVALNAIFFLNEKFIELTIHTEVLKALERYEEIFSLNYYEYWDSSNTVHYLHGKAIFSDNCVVNSDACIFSPVLDKPKSTFLDLCPSNSLFPADDLYPYAGFPLYKELSAIDKIEVFGVSPYGDEELLEKLSNISELVIYIHNMDIVQKDDWQKKISHAIFKDSDEFIKRCLV
jgi:hypothetical protein